MRVEYVLVALFAVATAVALVARRFRVPYTVALVIAGLALGTAHALEPPHLTRELLYAVFLPGLLFEASFALEFKKFWANKVAVTALAVPGLLLAIALTSFLLVPVVNGLHFVEDFTLLEGLVFAAVIAATDPIAVVGLFKALGAPKRLAVLVEGESLLNDGTAVVVFTIIVGVAAGQPFSLPVALVEFVRVVGMGVLVGLAFGYGASLVIQKVDDPMIEITVTTIAAYGSFVAAEHFHYSGVIATVTAGMLCGNYAARTGMSPSTRIAVATFWEYLAFALNSLVFLLIGFEVEEDALVAAWLPIVVGFGAVVLGRAAVIYLVSLLLKRSSEAIPWSWATVLTWGGLRGSLSMVLVLGLPQSLPHRDILVTMTFGVVILSILVQGLTMGPLLRRLGLVGHHGAALELERLRGQSQGAAAALQELTRLEQAGGVSSAALAQVRAAYEERQAGLRKAIDAVHLEAADAAAEERRRALVHALTAEKDALLSAKARGALDAAVLDELIADVDRRLVEASTAANV
ncbi:MAG: cation:proton antiporter [Myxococcaceae bacterium]|nr:cation:proton antiporter [Myxococcaceae bacterium]